MPDVPEHLVPTDGLTDSLLKYAGFDTFPMGGGGSHRFDFYDEAKAYIGTFKIEVQPTGHGTVDGQIAEAHRRMIDALRQWLHVTDKMRQAYEKSAAP